MKQIDVLPDDALLEIFDFYMILTDLSHECIPSEEIKKATEAWQLLVHVCRRWRSLVLGSPRRLNLRLFCTTKTPMKDTLDIWPALPLVVDSGSIMNVTSDADNIIAALGQSNRVCKVNLYVTGRLLEKVLAPMHVPFPELTDLALTSYNETPVIPDSFLGGSAPRLRHFELNGIPFPGLAKVLLSATHLVELRLIYIPYSGYISILPKSMVAVLSALSCLKILSLQFQFRRAANGSESRSLPLPKRSILPALRRLEFRGVTEYLEDLVSRIDTPQLDEMHITLVNQMAFECPQLAKFINRSPTLRTRDEAHVRFNHHVTSLVLLAQSRALKIEILGIERYRYLSFVRQICNSSLHPLSTVEDLYIGDKYSQLVRKKNAFDNTLWLQL